MSSSSNEIIEHIVLFKVKPSVDPSAMLGHINSLASLNIATHLSVGPISRCHSTNFDLSFTHMLHTRYPSKSALLAYLQHPSHLNVVANHVNPVVEDVMVVDWVAEEFSESPEIFPGSLARFTVVKIKEQETGGKDHEVVMGVIKDKFSGAEQLTIGGNFSPGKAKGYSISSVALLKDSDDSNMEVLADMDKVDDILVLDFVVAPKI